MMDCHRTSYFNEVTGDGKQIRWTLTGFELIKSGGGKYVFKHPDNNVVITVKSTSGVFQTMVGHELGVKLVFKKGKFEALNDEAPRVRARRNFIDGIADIEIQNVDKMSLEERLEREADEKYREEHGLDFYGKPIVYPGEEKPKEGS